MRRRLGVVALALVVGSCGGGTVGEVGGPELKATCGAVELTGGLQAELPSTPLDDDALDAMDALRRFASEEASFLDGYEWFIAARTDSSLVLFGRASQKPPDGTPAYADVALERTVDGYRPTGWGQCRIEVSAPGYGNAVWRLDGEPDPGTSALEIMINERACASGQPPVDRDVVPVVVADRERITITVLVEPARGDATCQSNPWYPVTVELEEPIGDRLLFDGSEVPLQERMWPPPEGDPLGSWRLLA
jgi:hypothetical protein